MEFPSPPRGLRPAAASRRAQTGSDVSFKRDYWLLCGTFLAMLAVFGLDALAPLGTAVWILYLLPLVMSFAGLRPWAPPVLAVVATIAITVGFFTDASGIARGVAAINRVMGVVVIVGMGMAGAAFVRYRLRLLDSDRLQREQVGVARAIQHAPEPEPMAVAVLSELGRALDARAAVAYMREGGRFVRLGGWGLPADVALPQSFAPGEGLLGRAVAEDVILGIETPAEAVLGWSSGLARGRPAYLAFAPVHDGNQVNGVMEFGLERPLDAHGRALLDVVSDKIGIGLRAASYRRRTSELLEETRRQAEELRAAADELSASNAELEEQKQALEDSQRRLEHQAQELEEQNTQLEAQTQELEQQREAISRSQRLVEQHAAALARESRYKSEFVANMSHELRTPLNALLIMARLLSENRGGNLSEEQVRWAGTIESSGQDLLVLINDILDLAKIEAGKLDLSVAETDPVQVAEKLRGSFAAQAAAKGLSLRVEAEPGVAIIETDRNRLEQVLRNFLSNALKFTEQGEVVLRLSRAGEGVAFAVRDTGIGIKPEEQAAVFEAFRQADGTISRRFGGTGLGLSISQQLAGLLNGRIELESVEGEGSSFTLILPARLQPSEAAAPAGSARLAPPPAAPAPVPAATADLPDAPAPMPGVEDDRDRLDPAARLLLVVEDDPVFARVLVELAHESGFQAVAAGTAEDALAAAHRFMPHAIILDVVLPDHSGLTVLDRLKRDTRTRHVPVHMVSSEDCTREALEQGALSYMMKPVRREELLESLTALGERLDRGMRHVLIVEDDPNQLDGLKALLGGANVETTGAATVAEGLVALRSRVWDCLVLDMTLPDATGFDLLEQLDQTEGASLPPVIVYTARVLTEAEEQRLRRYSRSIIIKGAKSPERLIDEVTLFLHQVVSDLPETQQKMLTASLNRDAALEGRRILVVEDDIRNIYALTAVFEPHGAEVQIARNGREALELLGRSADGAAAPVDLVLMDVMMPEMDGLTATREIRRIERWKALPIIMLTAKAMADDQEQCLAAGANDYLAKPLDVDKLLSLTRVWMPR